LIFSTAEIQERAQAAVDALELSQVARLALDLAQKFNAVYHRHPILQEGDADRRGARLAAAQIFVKGLRVLTDFMGLPIPDRM